MQRRDRRFDQLGNFLLGEPSRHAPVVTDIARRRNAPSGGFGVNGHKRDWGELARLFKRLRQVQGGRAAREVLAELERFLETKNAAALASLHEAGEDLIALHKLEVPSTLHASLLSTNVIENSFRNVRRKLGRVTRFRVETDQSSRWMAYALDEAEKGFRRIQGYAALKHLKAALARPPVPFSEASAPPPVACAPSVFADASEDL